MIPTQTEHSQAPAPEEFTLLPLYGCTSGKSAQHPAAQLPFIVFLEKSRQFQPWPRSVDSQHPNAQEMSQPEILFHPRQHIPLICHRGTGA